MLGSTKAAPEHRAAPNCESGWRARHFHEEGQPPTALHLHEPPGTRPSTASRRPSTAVRLSLPPVPLQDCGRARVPAKQSIVPYTPHPSLGADLVVDEFEAYDVEQSEELGSWHLAGNKIEKVESTAGSEYHRQWGDGKGFVLSTAGGSRRFMFKQAESRDKWVEKLRLVIAALDDAAREEDPDVPSIEIAITLNMAMPTVGRGRKHHLKGGRTPSQDVDDFQEDLKTDLVMATSGCRDKINITNVQEGLQSSFRIYYEDRALLYII